MSKSQEKHQYFKSINLYQNTKDFDSIYMVFNKIITDNTLLLDKKFITHIMNKLVFNISNVDKLFEIYNLVFNSFDVSYINESLLSTFIRKYSDLFYEINNSDIFLKSFNTNLESLFELLKLYNFKIKQRNISPMILFYLNSNNFEKITKYYTISKHNLIILMNSDYIHIINYAIKHNYKSLLQEILYDISKIFENIPDILCSKLKSLEKVIVDKNGSVNKVNKVNKNNSNYKNLRLGNYIINSVDKQFLLDLFSKLINEKIKNNSFKEYCKYLKKNQPKIILDAANIGYMNNSKNSTNMNFTRIDQAYSFYKNKNLNVSIILHKRHFNNINNYEQRIIDKWIAHNSLFKTPYNIDDDLFWLYGCLLNEGCYFVTNDKLKNHYFQIMQKREEQINISPFLFWYNDYNITYSFVHKKFNPENIKNYSIKIQLFNTEESNICIIPTDTNKWFLLEY